MNDQELEEYIEKLKWNDKERDAFLENIGSQCKRREMGNQSSWMGTYRIRSC